jgi:YggT family protein
MSWLIGLPWLLVWLYLLVLLARLVLDWVQMFARDWRPRGVMLVIAESVYSATDPPIRALRRIIPPLRLGAVQLDLGFMVLFFGLGVLLTVLPKG